MTVSIPMVPPPNRRRDPPWQFPNQFGAPTNIPKPNPST